MVGDVEVDPVREQLVAGVRTGEPLGSEDRSQAADQHRDLLRWPRRRATRPQAVDQARDRDRLASGHGQDLDEGARLAASQSMLVDAVDVQGAKHADLQLADYMPT